MDPKTINLLIQLGVTLANLALDLKKQAGLTDEQLLDAADQNSAETLAAVEKFLAELK